MIRGISDPGQMTQPLLEQLLKESLVEPLAIRFDQMAHTRRTESFRGSDLRSLIPYNSMAGRMVRSGNFDHSDYFDHMGQDRQVSRVSIPFTGDPVLLQYAPNPCGMSFPQGEVYDHKIQFDVILWGGSPDDRQRAKTEIRNNLEQLAACASKCLYGKGWVRSLGA